MAGEGIAEDLNRSAPAAAIVLKIVIASLLDGVGATTRCAESLLSALLVEPPTTGRDLRLREVEHALPVGVLKVVSERELAFAIETVVETPARDPGASGGAPAVSEMETFLERAPVRLVADRKAQAGGAGGE